MPVNKPRKKAKNKRPMIEKNTDYFTGVLETALDIATEMANLDPVNMNNAEDISERVEYYFDRCRDLNCVPDVAGLANALGIKRKEFLQLAESGENDPRIEVLSRAQGRLNSILTFMSKRSAVNPTMAIMDLANDFGYSRAGEVVFEKKEKVKQLTAEQIAQKYAGLLDQRLIVDVEVVEKEKPQISCDLVTEQVGE